MKKLGVIVRDTVTDSSGMLTVLEIDMDYQKWYYFQPKRLNPETGLPVKGYWLTEARIDGPTVPDPDLHLEMLGTEAEDMGSGFKGIVINIDYYINGCLHVNLQSKGTLGRTNENIKAYNLDIRRLKGEKVPTFETEEEKELDQVKKPSPVYGSGSPLSDSPEYHPERE